MTMICASVFLAGCDWFRPTERIAEGPLFCDVEQVRRFTQAEIDARAAFPANLRLDLATNERGRDSCGW